MKFYKIIKDNNLVCLGIYYKKIINIFNLNNLEWACSIQAKDFDQSFKYYCKLEEITNSIDLILFEDFIEKYRHKSDFLDTVNPTQ